LAWRKPFHCGAATAGTLPRSECFSALARACPIAPIAVAPKLNTAWACNTQSGRSCCCGARWGAPA
jgi:hypothetical protein